MLGTDPCDKQSASAMTEKILGLGVANTLITLGKDGCAYRENGKDVKFNGVYPVNVVDTTAAGDSFIGGFCRKLSEGASVDEAVKYATAVSAITISRQGAATSIPCADEVDEFIKSNSQG
jgi:ribokinase